MHLKKYSIDGVSLLIACFLLAVGLDFLVHIVSGYSTVLIDTPKEASSIGLFLLMAVYLFMSGIFFYFAFNEEQ